MGYVNDATNAVLEVPNVVLITRNPRTTVSFATFDDKKEPKTADELNALVEPAPIEIACDAVAPADANADVEDPIQIAYVALACGPFVEEELEPIQIDPVALDIGPFFPLIPAPSAIDPEPDELGPALVESPPPMAIAPADSCAIALRPIPMDDDDVPRDC